MIPLMVNCSGKNVTIFGGGEVGARKARYFADEADVTVCSRSFSPEFQSIPVRQVQIDLRKKEEIISPYIKGAFLVIAATSDPELNTMITDQCREAGTLCNNATSPPGDVTLPARCGGDQFTIAVSTRGGSPAVARFIRENIENSWPYLDQMIILEEQLRHELKEKMIPQDKRKEILTAVLHDPDVWQMLHKGISDAKHLIHARYLI